MYPNGNHVLVVDSDPRRREITERVLADEGFAVTAVAEGFSAIRAVAGDRFALAIVAMELPGSCDGATTLRQLRLRQPGLKALLTGAAAMRPGRRDDEHEEFIVAPFQHRDFLGSVYELLQRSAMRPRDLGVLDRAG